MPKSRCSGKKFIEIIKLFSDEKKEVIIGLRFRGLLELCCTKLRSELCNWLIENYKVGYHRLHVPLYRLQLTINLALGVHNKQREKFTKLF